MRIIVWFIFTLVHIASKYQFLLTLKHAWSRYITEENMKMSGHPESSSGCLISSGSASDGYGGMWHDEGTIPPPECLGLTSRSAFDFPRDWDYLVLYENDAWELKLRHHQFTVCWLDPGFVSADFSTSSSHGPMRIADPKGNSWGIFSGLLRSYICQKSFYGNWTPLLSPSWNH
jgi:hypothetical protein